MTASSRSWSWRYTLQFKSGRVTQGSPTTKHAVPDGTNVSLCNREPYWRLPEDVRRWLGADPAEAELAATLKPCQGCMARLAEIERETLEPEQ